jgi:hypothetical protein
VRVTHDESGNLVLFDIPFAAMLWTNGNDDDETLPEDIEETAFYLCDCPFTRDDEQIIFDDDDRALILDKYNKAKTWKF